MFISMNVIYTQDSTNCIRLRHLAMPNLPFDAKNCDTGTIDSTGIHFQGWAILNGNYMHEHERLVQDVPS